MCGTFLLYFGRSDFLQRLVVIKKRRDLFGGRLMISGLSQERQGSRVVLLCPPFVFPSLDSLEAFSLDLVGESVACVGLGVIFDAPLNDVSS